MDIILTSFHIKIFIQNYSVTILMPFGVQKIGGLMIILCKGLHGNYSIQPNFISRMQKNIVHSTKAAM